MGKRILVCYLSFTGSTAEVAEEIAKVMGEEGAEAVALPLKDVRPADLEGASAVVLGSVVRMSRVPGKTVAFLKRNLPALSRLPVAYFTVGLAMRPGWPNGPAQTADAIKPLKALKEPVAVGHFAGLMDWSRLTGMWRYVATKSGEDQFKEGDWRDWSQIAAWARGLVSLLLGR